MADGEPDLLFGIDIGMSCSGVAYINRTRGNNMIKTFSHWGNPGIEYKTPTRLRYSKDDLGGTAEPLSWGFECAASPDGEDSQVIEWFKTDLGDMEQARGKQAKVKRYYEDYLRCLYNTLRDHFSSEHLGGKSWASATIHFYFSTPATWDPSTVNVFKEIAIRSGFASQQSFHVNVELTEPHAVAAYTLVEEPGLIKKAESVLIVDAGGGTVDLCFVTVVNADKGQVEMTEVKAVQGKEFGATYIDFQFESLLENRLRELSSKDLLHYSVEVTAWEMRNSDTFQSNKHRFGCRPWDDDEKFRIKIPGIKTLEDDATLGIRRGEMEFTWYELRVLFDTQVAGITDNIDAVMSERSVCRGDSRNVNVSHILLSGGLGSSKYVQSKIKEYLDGGPHKLLEGAQLHASGRPQLSVCWGLLNHAEQNLSGRSMFRCRRARLSVGVLCRLDYKRPKLEGMRTSELQKLAKEKDKVKVVDGHLWINDCIEWCVRRNSTIPESGKITSMYSVLFRPDTEHSARVANVQLVTSLEAQPPMFKEAGLVRHQATMIVNLSEVQPVKEGFMKKISSKRRGIQVRFLIEAAIGITDVNFRCLDPLTKTQIGESVGIGLEYDEHEIPVTNNGLPILGGVDQP